MRWLKDDDTGWHEATRDPRRGSEPPRPRPAVRQPLVTTRDDRRTARRGGVPPAVRGRSLGPSAFNNQHWRFVYAAREDEEWDDLVDLLNEAKQAWATDAAVLAVITSKTTFDHNGEPAPIHSFDTGAAWKNLALEGARRGLAVHAIAGFDYERAAEELGVPAEFDVEAMVAIGERAPAETLPGELREHEDPSGRKPLDETVPPGGFE